MSLSLVHNLFITVFYSISLDDRTTPWRSIWIATGLLTFTGAQMSVYFMSTLPYLSTVDSSVGISFFGYVIAAVSFGCMVSNPIFGYWLQKTNSTKWPVFTGFFLAMIGNFLYANLSLFGENIRMMALLSRILTGFGAGTLGVLRGFVSVASTAKDRMTAVAYASAGFTFGLSVGPIIQIIFMPFGTEGFSIGPFVINMYTTTAYFMTIACFLCVVLIVVFLVEDYVGIYSEEDKKADPFLVIPKYDWFAIIICLYFWFFFCMMSTTIESMAVPLTIAMYNWNNSQSILINGILMMANCMASVITNGIMAKTRLGRMDRRLQLLIGLLLFSLHILVNYPWFFYNGPLQYTPIVNGTENLDVYGGCSKVYKWCENTTKVPQLIYYISFTVMGIAFSFMAAPVNALYSEILGPRKQGMMQGLLAFTGSFSQLITPIVVIHLFESSGYRFIMLFQFIMSIIGILLLLLYYTKMVPLRMVPPTGEVKRYKRGYFTRF